VQRLFVASGEVEWSERLTLAAAAQLLGVGVNTERRLVRSGHLEAPLLVMIGSACVRKRSHLGP